MSYFEKWQGEQGIKMFSTCFNFTILGAKAFAKLKLFELAITWCDQGLAVSFYSLYSSMAEIKDGLFSQVVMHTSVTNWLPFFSTNGSVLI